ncbi:hypothetical protein CONLIGDRAFT_657235 [Coniochaeta ligniaria NRRL 30616]|uniref:DUF833-domain-containing protein n=1 Tax=Coniochaeta ligniaria NRRL 30616 TaxID=1408157 RepID=A0A1J7IU28_9PEZI|nr:hypothetical protein CONLIGDRAFT_657235 [Coniochaeta ligniaria NRRL 30616]
MCIVLLTTAHPSYALIVVDNRDEFILRPTSRPHWWTSVPEKHTDLRETQEVLSSRDLQRAEQGTWLGVTKDGNIAVLTNYRETNTNDSAHPVHGTRSRGGMVTAWLGANPHEKVSDFVSRMLGGGVGNVGGFSLICGKLRPKRHGDSGQKALEPLAIISNRNDSVDKVPWICEERGQVYGLSNTCYGDPNTWPKVEIGERLLSEAVKKAVDQNLDEEGLMDELFKILDTDTLPQQPDMAFEDCIATLKHSIFIPPIGDEHHKSAMERARARGKIEQFDEATEELRKEERPDETSMGFETGMYGTQRQTVILVDWEGNVTFRERALWNKHGHPIARPEGDMTFRFKIDGWEDGRGSML